MDSKPVHQTPNAVPFSARLKLATGFRVPSAHREWAVSQIKSKGYPYRRVISMLIVAWPAAIVGSLIPRLFGSGSYEGQIFYPLVFFPIGFVVVSLVFAALDGKRMRAMALRKQLKEKSPA